MNASVDLQWYDIVRTMKGDDVSQYINGFAETFGSRTDVQVNCHPVKGTQSLKISGGKLGLTTLTGLVEMHIKNPFAVKEGRDMNAVTM